MLIHTEHFRAQIKLMQLSPQQTYIAEKMISQLLEYESGADIEELFPNTMQVHDQQIQIMSAIYMDLLLSLGDFNV